MEQRRGTPGLPHGLRHPKPFSSGAHWALPQNRVQRADRTARLSERGGPKPATAGSIFPAPWSRARRPQVRAATLRPGTNFAPGGAGLAMQARADGVRFPLFSPQSGKPHILTLTYPNWPSGWCPCAPTLCPAAVRTLCGSDSTSRKVGCAKPGSPPGPSSPMPPTPAGLSTERAASKCPGARPSRVARGWGAGGSLLKPRISRNAKPGAPARGAPEVPITCLGFGLAQRFSRFPVISRSLRAEAASLVLPPPRLAPPPHEVGPRCPLRCLMLWSPKEIPFYPPGDSPSGVRAEQPITGAKSGLGIPKSWQLPPQAAAGGASARGQGAGGRGTGWAL